MNLGIANHGQQWFEIRFRQVLLCSSEQVDGTIVESSFFRLTSDFGFRFYRIINRH